MLYNLLIYFQNSAKEIPLDIILEKGYDTNLTIQLKDIQSGKSQ